MTHYTDFIICPVSNPLYVEITAVSSSKEGCLAALLKYMLKEGIDIQVLKKTARGNSHDENWQDLYTVVGDAPYYADILADIKDQTGGLYVDKPIIETVDALNDDAITKWVKPFEYYSGEEKDRYIYAVVNGERCVYRIREAFPESPTLSAYQECCNWRPELNIRVVMAKRLESEMTLEERAKLKQQIVRETGRKSAIKSKKDM